MSGPTPTSLRHAGVRYSSLDVEVSRRRGDGASKNAAAVKAADRFTLSAKAANLRVSRTVVETTLSSGEASLASADYDTALTNAYTELASSPFESAGKTEYLDSISNPSDLSAEATAGRILGGVAGYIFGAFQLQNPDFAFAEFEGFHAAVSEGFERGLRDAADILRGLSILTNEGSQGIAETTEIVRAGLADFYDTIADTFREPPASAAGGVQAA